MPNSETGGKERYTQGVEGGIPRVWKEVYPGWENSGVYPGWENSGVYPGWEEKRGIPRVGREERYTQGVDNSDIPRVLITVVYPGW